jgi:hypothetical protein
MPNSSKKLKNIQRDVEDTGPELAALPDGETKTRLERERDKYDT